MALIDAHKRADAEAAAQAAAALAGARAGAAGAAAERNAVAAEWALVRGVMEEDTDREIEELRDRCAALQPQRAPRLGHSSPGFECSCASPYRL